MASAAQLQANRLNALKSTGPRTPTGKAVSRFNALKSGLDARSIVIPGELAARLPLGRFGGARFEVNRAGNLLYD